MKQFKKSATCSYMINGGQALEVIDGDCGKLICTVDLADVEEEAEECSSEEFYKAYDSASRVISEFAAVPLPSVFINENLRAFHK